MKPKEKEELFKVKGDGSIERIETIGATSVDSSILEKELLNIIEVNSYSKNILAAYRARKIANKISKQKYGKENYKEYVEMLMVKHCSKELEKARLGAKYLLWLRISIIFWPVSVILIRRIVVPCYKKLKAL